ncbi:arginine--tRNA ligase [Aliikangiella sp. G2MR2-5]|uniref:arginine--tRNA ligase n=1 Tax=Aliikangiella sp. G2MR2-5 TaxID=2788943 RepID=UPI0018A88524|nr:arginine--tRNA ligase [Aliikangiella sp. G2MR2-5]
MKAIVEGWLEQAIAELKSQEVVPESFSAKAQVTHTKDKSHGDFASNAALMMAKQAGKAPREIAQLIIDLIGSRPEIAKLEIAGPGFINFFLSQAAATQVVKEVLEQKGLFGHNNSGEGKKVQVEFVSANPTGPLHIGHGRNAALGDCICRLLEATGWDVTREFYYNDAGAQIDNLAISVQARCKGLGPDSESWPEDGYRGDYIIDVANDYMNGEKVDAEDKHVIGKGDPEDLQAIREFAVAYLRREQDLDLKAFAVKFDVFFLESSLYENKAVDDAVTRMIENGHTYEKEGALWLRTTEFGDDKDRVMRKTDGGYTYFVPDVAYHLNKWNRGFEKVINVQGADHHSTVTRVRAGLQALDAGISQGFPDYSLYQMVTVMRGNEEVKISKRAGSYVTLRDIIEEVGGDATRYFLAARRGASQMTFDLELAASQTTENPVFYIQYAHARICSTFRKLKELSRSHNSDNGLANLSLLKLDHEMALLDRMTQFPELVKVAANNLEPHVIAHYLRDLAADLHGYYQIGSDDASARWIVDNVDLSDARLCLIDAVRQVLANGLTLLAVSAPEQM